MYYGILLLVARLIILIFFQKKGDWPFDKSNWVEQGKWEGIWDSNDKNLPELINSHINWIIILSFTIVQTETMLLKQLGQYLNAVGKISSL